MTDPPILARSDPIDQVRSIHPDSDGLAPGGRCNQPVNSLIAERLHKPAHSLSNFALFDLFNLDSFFVFFWFESVGLCDGQPSSEQQHGHDCNPEPEGGERDEDEVVGPDRAST